MSQAIKVGELKFSVALDNYEPSRSVAYGVADVWRMANGERALRIGEAEAVFKGSRDALYLVDDGKSVIPHYVGGWNDAKRPGELFLYPLPTNADGRTRPDGQLIDYGTWMLGPKRAYHLKVTQA